MLREIEAEFAAQIERVRAAGITPSHLDTEKHLHVLPGIAAIVLNLAKRYGIPAVRFPFEDGRAIIRVAPMQRLKAGVSGVLFKRRVERLFCESGMARTDHFRGISLSGRFTPQNLTEVLASLPNGTTELSCHPGRPGSTYASYIAPHRAAELETLTDLSVADALAAHDITLTSFHELYGNR